jgi:hypothetical protein
MESEMAKLTSEPPPQRYETLISRRSITVLTAACGGLLVFTALAVAGSHVLGRHIADAGKTTSTTPVSIDIGSDSLSLPGNVIRFASQRRDGPANSVDLYFEWPGMAGYGHGNKELFNGWESGQSLIFISLSQRIMSQDMSGRYAPIYSHMVRDTASSGPSGLLEYDLAEVAGYAGERLFVERTDGKRPYVARCLDENSFAPMRETSTACQRDILIGTDIAVLYRFPEALLEDWRRLDTEISAYLAEALAAR